MQKKFQIFVSSTYQDLIEERRAVIEAILDLGHIPIGVEAFQASNEEQWSYIRKRIDEADYYVVIVAERYGSTNDQGVSFTEMEYDYAREKGVPVAAFLLHEDARPEWREKKVGSLDNRKKIDAFRSKCQGLLVRYWSNNDELAVSCVKSLTQMFISFPRDGWIPAREATGSTVSNELARLSIENQQLRADVAALSEAKNSDANTAGNATIARLMAQVHDLRDANGKLSSTLDEWATLISKSHIRNDPDALVIELTSTDHRFHARQLERAVRGIRAIYNIFALSEIGIENIEIWPHNNISNAIWTDDGIPPSYRLHISWVEHGSISLNFKSGSLKILGYVSTMFNKSAQAKVDQEVAQANKLASDAAIANLTKEAKANNIIEEQEAIQIANSKKKFDIWRDEINDRVLFAEKILLRVKDPEKRAQMRAELDSAICDLLGNQILPIVKHSPDNLADGENSLNKLPPS